MFNKDNVHFYVGAAVGVTVGLVVGKMLSPNISRNVNSEVRNMQSPICQNIGIISKDNNIYDDRYQCHTRSRSAVRYKDIKSKNSILLASQIKPTLNDSKININNTMSVKNMKDKMSSIYQSVERTGKITNADTHTTSVKETEIYSSESYVPENIISNIKKINDLNCYTSSKYLSDSFNSRHINISMHQCTTAEENETESDNFVNMTETTQQSIGLINMGRDTLMHHHGDNCNSIDNTSISPSSKMNSMYYANESIPFPNSTNMAMCNTSLDMKQTNSITSISTDYENDTNQYAAFNKNNLISSTMYDVSITF